MASWMPIHTPNLLIMRILYLMQLSIVLLPINYLAASICRYEYFFFERVPFEDVDGVFVAVKFVYFLLHIPNIIQFNLAIFTTCEQISSINWVPFDLLNCGCVGEMLEDAFSVDATRIPYANCVICASSADQRLNRMPIHSSYIRVMLLKQIFLF